MSRVLPWQDRWVDLGHPIGSERSGRRPAVVVASELHCRFPIDLTLVAPLTTKVRRHPHRAPLAAPDACVNQAVLLMFGRWYVLDR